MPLICCLKMDKLKLYRVVVYTSGRPTVPEREFIVLGYDGNTACDLALKKLRQPTFSDTGDRSHLKIEEVKGPFEEGRILYYRSYNGDDDFIIQDA